MYPHERSLVKQMSGRPFVLLGVNNDKEEDTVKEAIKENDLNWRSWIDGKGGPIVKKFKIRGFPTILLIDHEGVIRYHSSEHRIRAPKVLDATIEALVAAAEAAGPSLREFVDASGKFKIMGSYDRFVKGKVYLIDENDEEKKIPWSKLSTECQNYVASKRLKEDGYGRFVKKDVAFPFDKPMKFTDKSGDHSIRATYIGLDRTNVIFYDKAGKEIKIRYRDLSQESKDMINSENKRRKATSPNP